MSNTIFLLFPTSPSIAQFVGEYGFWIIAGAVTLSAIGVILDKPNDDVPWIQPRK